MRTEPDLLDCLAWLAFTPWPWPGWALAGSGLALTFHRRYREYALPCLVSGWCGTVGVSLLGFTISMQQLFTSTCGSVADVNVMLNVFSAPLLPVGLITPIVLVRNSGGLLRSSLPLLACLVGACLPHAVALLLCTPFRTLQGLLP